MLAWKIIPPVLLFTMLIHSAICTTPISDWIEGTASFFGGPQVQGNASNTYKLTLDSGSCGYGEFNPRLYPNYNVVGIHPSNELAQDRPQTGCGSCLEIQCTSGPQICYADRKPLQVVITDQCVQDCNATNINMHVFSFEDLAPIKYGRIDIKYRLIDCEPTDPIAIHISDYRATLGGWMRLSLKNIAGDAGLTSIEVGPAGSNVNAAAGEGGWQLMTNTFGAVWEASALPNPPIDIRLENSILQTVVIKNAITTAGMTGDVETTAQFPVPNAETTVTAAAAPTVIVGRAVKFVPHSATTNTTSTAGVTAATATPNTDGAAASSAAAAAGPSRNAPPAAVASSSAAVVPPEAAGATQGGAPNPLTTAGTGQDPAASGDMVQIDGQPAAASAVPRKASAVVGRRMLG